MSRRLLLRAPRRLRLRALLQSFAAEIDLKLALVVQVEIARPAVDRREQEPDDRDSDRESRGDEIELAPRGGHEPAARLQGLDEAQPPALRLRHRQHVKD